MKRFLLSSLLFLAGAHTGFCYLNTGTVQVPPMNPQLVAIDDPNFVNKGTFNVDLSAFESPLSGTVLYTTSDTLNYTNYGVMIGNPGFDFETFPASAGVQHMAANFVNTNTGIGGGQILISGSQFGLNTIFGNLIFPINFETVGLATLKVRATNVLDSGLISMDDTGLIDISGVDVDLRKARFVMTGGNTFSNATFGVSSLDYGIGQFGTNTLGGWDAFDDLTPTEALSPIYLSTVTGFFEQMFLSNAIPYFQNLTPAAGPDNTIVWRGIYLQDSSPSNVTKNVYFDTSGVGSGAFHIEWAGEYRDPTTGQIATNYFYLSDVPVIRRNTNTFFIAFPGIPSDFSFAEGPTRLIVGTPATPGFINPAPIGLMTNDYSYVNVRPNAVLVDTNTVVGGSPTNLPGRIYLTASRSMNLANVHITGPNYLSLISSNNFLGNSNAVITAPYSDLNIGVTNGSLTFSNLLLPQLPSWTGVPGAPSAVSEFGFTFAPIEMGGIQAWSGSYIFVDDNGVTNDVRMLLVNSALQPSTPALQQDVILHATNSLIISDALNIFRHFFSDATTLTLSTNANTAFSLAGQLNLLSEDNFWSASLPNLQYLTNWGVITTKNLANFAGNMLSTSSDPANAIPYKAFVNHGTIINQGTFIRANYFEDNGVIQEDQANGIDIAVSTGIATNSSFLAPNGSVSIAADSLLINNGVIVAGQSLTLAASCSLSDGFAFENQFAHATNATLPNVVTNGNTWFTAGGVRILVKPPTADLLGTTITNVSLNGLDSINEWPGNDRGCSPGGYATNLALGRLILNADATSQFSFVSLTGSNALYVDSIELQGNTTNTDNNGNPLSIDVQPGMKIYFAQAIQNGVSIAEKLNGKDSGGFCWVSNYAGVYSSTNIIYPDGNTYIFNEALAISPDIASGGPDGSSGIVNVNNPYPIPTNTLYDIVNIGPQPCGSSVTNSPGNPGNPGNPPSPVPAKLDFPVEQSQSQPEGSNSVVFATAAGTYNGLFYDTNGVSPLSSGFFSAKVTSKGGLSAKLQFGGRTYSFSKPSFDPSGHLSTSISSKNLVSPLGVNLQLINNNQITGEISSDGWRAQLLADRAAFSTKNKTALLGNDTLVLATDEENSTAAAGDSFGSVAISKSGGVQWSGVLPDGTKVTQKSSLSKDGVWPLYSAPYKGLGSFIGWMQCSTNADSRIEGSAVWIMPPGQKALYPHGLTNELDATGSSVPGPLETHHVNAVLSGAFLTPPLTNSVMFFGKTGQSTNSTLKLSVNLKTGLFTGSVVDPESSQKLSFQGALLDKSGIGGGFFLNADQHQGGKVNFAPAN